MSPERIIAKVKLEKVLVEELRDVIDDFKRTAELDSMLVDPNHSEKSDVYSFGVMFWEILSQSWPYVDMIETESYSELFELILGGKRPDLAGIEKELAAIIVKCWQPNPRRRPTFREIVPMLQQAWVSLELPTTSCPEAATFWTTKFGEATRSIAISQLVQETSNNRWVKQEYIETVLICLYALFTGRVHDVATDVVQYHITLEDFGKLIKWFGPLKLGCMVNMVSLMQTPGFFGIIEKSEVENRLQTLGQDKTFLIRLNTGGNIAISKCPFVISIWNKPATGAAACIHIRVFSQKGYGNWVCRVGDRKYKSKTLINIITQLTADDIISKPLEPSPFEVLWSEQAGTGEYTQDPVSDEASSTEI